MRIIMKRFGVPFAAMVSAVLAIGAQAADTAMTASVSGVNIAEQPIEEVGELDEIWVRGQRLSKMIEDAEDDFFVLYNKLNKNYDYDVFCGGMSLQSGSMIIVRSCVPGFIVTNYGDAGGRISDWGDGCGGWGDWGGYAADFAYAMYSSCTGARRGTPGGYAYAPAIPSVEPVIRVPAEHMMMFKRPAYAANVLKVVTSDPRLLEKVRNLGDLYKDMKLVQGRYVQVKREASPPRGNPRNARYSGGPRAL